MSRHICLKIAYEGSSFLGYQRQGPEQPNTVQGQLESILSQILDEPITLKAAGRTDAGVHAIGQVVSFRTSRERHPDEVARSLNKMLQGRLQVRQATLVSEDFHPRFSALTRTYHYHLLTAPGAALFFRHRAWCLERPLEVEPMAEAAATLLGEHDFVSYSSRVPKDENTVRKLHRLRVTQQRLPPSHPLWNFAGHRVTVEVEANAFLRRMVRLLVSALVEVGLAHSSVNEPRRLLELCDNQAAPPAAPPGGLYLAEVSYPEGFEITA